MRDWSSDVCSSDLGDRNKIKAVVALLQRFGVKDFVRAGTVAMRRSMQLAD